MALRNLVFCADGTGNSFDTQVSNVSRLVRSLVLDRADEQRVFYDQGVGTRPGSVAAARRFKDAAFASGLEILPEPLTSWWPARSVARVAGLGFGFGLKANIRQLHAALSRHYESDTATRLFLFGFSRGAFTVRALAAFVHRCGLLPADRPRYFDEAYTRFFEERHEERMPPADRAGFRSALAAFRRDKGARPCRVDFLGIWDTVKSYGFIYPRSLPHLRHNPSVCIVRHALALNERRSYFQPTSWGGVDHPVYSDARGDDAADVGEVWFAGSHSDVGGGYPPARSGLARAPFEWMVREARRQCLHIDDARLRCVLREYASEQCLNESLEKAWWLAELLPRFELENIPFPGTRVIRWGSTGQRDPRELARQAVVSVHASVREVYAQSGLTLALRGGAHLRWVE